MPNQTEASATLCADLKARIDALYLNYVFPVLATIRLGEDPETVRFETALLLAAKETGVRVRRYIFPADTPLADIETLLRETSLDFLLSAILLERPLPQGWDGAALDELIAPAKRLPQPEGATLTDAVLLLQKVADAAERNAK